jgi:hypothetical protein
MSRPFCPSDRPVRPSGAGRERSRSGSRSRIRTAFGKGSGLSRSVPAEHGSASARPFSPHAARPRPAQPTRPGAQGPPGRSRGRRRRRASQVSTARQVCTSNSPHMRASEGVTAMARRAVPKIGGIDLRRSWSGAVRLRRICWSAARSRGVQPSGTGPCPSAPGTTDPHTVLGAVICTQNDYVHTKGR